ncbi:uncharacterized protein LOC111047693 [Nilaparvata lugens]|uniref:uncharacterized protein LOC111047693 n=1 Tax=Nilaparvata lugens TaxID=108931 RepID=UPI00193E1FE4|nr:uncharacterized protein LOC111047693 [Nilaparvata lugens]
MKMSKVGNQTNSQDPQAVNSRVFVGNLNTFQCSKTDVERMFQRYGRLAGISMHKGYAFVQFTNPFDARSACLGEDGRTVLGQILDVNMVAEPKPHQTGRKRQNVAKTGNDWDYYYDSYYASATAAFPGALGGAGGPGPRLVPPLKRPRLMAVAQSGGVGGGVTGGAPPRLGAPPSLKVMQQQHKVTAVSQAGGLNGTAAPLLTTQVAQLKTYSNPDILICGNCREMFTELQELMDHKKSYCKLRFTCKCSVTNGPITKSGVKPEQDLHTPDQTTNSSTVSLMCVQCKDSFFGNAWDLMVHVQAAHMLNIYELGVAPNGVSSPSNGILGVQSPSNGVLGVQSPSNGVLAVQTPSNGIIGVGSPSNGVVASERLSAAEQSPDESVVASCSPQGSPIVGGARMELDNGGEIDMMTSPDIDEDLCPTPQVESTAQACIMHALHIENAAGTLTSAAAKILVNPLTNGELLNAHE